MILPPEATPLLLALAPAFTRPTFRRFVTLLGAALLTPGRRTVANLLRTLGPLAAGHVSSYRRVLSAASWSGLQLACLLTRWLVPALLPAGALYLAGDDTVDGHKGKRVYGKARHRDPVRPTQSHTAWRYGHKGVVLAVLVRSPFATRPWALPVLVDLYRSPQDNRRRNRPHRTPAQLLCRLVRRLLRWSPDRQFVLVGDSGYGSHEGARFCRRHRARLTPVSKLSPEANLFGPPPPYRGQGRPRVKGAPLPKPQEAVAAARTRRRLTVGWYGGGRRRVEVVSGTGHGYKSGRGLVPLRWVYVRDRTGTHRDEYFYSTDPSMAAEALIGHDTARWDIETTSQERRAHLGLGSTRGWCARTVLRAAPCLFGLYTVVALLYQALPAEKRTGAVHWPGKATVTFSDALTAVRRWLWADGVLTQADAAAAVHKLPLPVQDLLLSALTPAA
jgi:DDE superfamily endonuclease